MKTNRASSCWNAATRHLSITPAGNGRDPYAGELSLGAFPTLAPYCFPHILDHFIDSNPNLHNNLTEERTTVLVEQLKTGTLDAAFLALPADEPELEHPA